jgi:Co/Zn/Cd efflux system component
MIKLQIQMVLTIVMFLAEIIVGYMSGSVALIADSIHMLSDVFALFIAWYALKV